MTKQRIFSGMQPSGKFHLGNYMGALENWIHLQDEYECFFSIVDLHSLTSMYEDTSQLKDYTFQKAMDWLSAGLDPEKNTIFVQSHVPEHSELHLLLSMMTPLSWLERVPTYKDKLQNLGEMGKEINTYGFLGYPELMSADIMLYKAEVVPVGEDQIPHVELCREVIRRFNHLYSPVFPEPKTKLSKAPSLPGTDGRKMSKSYGNTIPFAATEEEIWERLRGMITDPQRVRRTDPGNPDVCPVFSLQKIFNPSEVPEIDAACRSAEIGCVDCKKKLLKQMSILLTPIHERRIALEAQPEKVREILAFGAERARKAARQTMEEVRSAMGFY